MLKIAVIVLNWNNARDTLECLESIFASNDSHYAVYVVDNGSKDDSLSILQQAYPQVHYLALDANYGFAEGNNRAMQHAIQDGCEYLFLLNNDAVVRKDTISLLRAAADRFPNACALGPRIYWYDRPTTLWFSGGQWDAHRATCMHIDWGLDESEAPIRPIATTGYVCGCAIFVRASFLKEVGLMDARYFLNWEEVDWCWRMRKMGFDCLVVPHARVWHKGSSSFIGGHRGPMWSYFFYRNRLLWMEKNLPRKEFLMALRRVIWPHFRTLWKTREDPSSRAALKGMRDYLLRKFDSGSVF